MEDIRIISILKSQHSITNVELNEKEDDANNITKYVGYLNISSLKGMFSFMETPVMDILNISYGFEYALAKKEKKESIYEVINQFNKTKVGIKATLKSFSKGTAPLILFSSEIITPPKSELLKESLFIITPVLSAGAILFGNDLSLKKISHKPITR